MGTFSRDACFYEWRELNLSSFSFQSKLTIITGLCQAPLIIKFF